MVKRKEYLSLLNLYKEKQLIKVVTGIRRCGKSTLMEQFKDELISSGVSEEQIIFLNFEALENEWLLDYKELYNYLSDKLCKDKFTYIFLDEIQKVEYFEKVVDSLYIKPLVDIYITGSNAYMLSGELATYLSGRYIEIKMLPLSFKEYCELFDGEDKVKLFSEYMNYGGLPYSAMLHKGGISLDNTYIEGIYNTVFVKDIEERQKRKEPDSTKRKITDIPLLKNIAKYLSSVIGSPVSMKSIADYLTSTGRKISHVTVGDYVDALEETYLYYRVDRMEVNGKEILKQNQKYYIADLGFRSYVLAKQKYDIGFSLENIVFLELFRRGYKINVGKVGNTEVDFVAYKDGIYEYYQVTTTMLDEKVFNREITPLRNIQDNYKKVIITSDSIGLGDYDGIKVINIIDWLLN